MTEFATRSARREPKQRRSRLREQRILDVAWALYCEPGAGEVSVREVCAAADTSPSSFYARYRDRAGLLEAIIDRFEREFLSTVEEAIAAPHVGNDLATFVYLVVTSTLDLVSRRAPLVGRVRRAALEEPRVAERWKIFEVRSFAAAEASLERVHPGPQAKAIAMRHRTLSPAIEAIYRGIDSAASPPPFDQADTSTRRMQIARDLTGWLLADARPATVIQGEAGSGLAS